MTLRVGTTAAMLSVPNTEPAIVKDGLIRLAALAAPRLASEGRRAAVVQPPRTGGGSMVPYLMIEVGDCMSRFQRHPGGGLGITTASCDGPHVAEITGVLDISSMFPDHYPDDAEQRDAFLTKCATSAGLHLGLFDEDTLPRTVEALRDALTPMIVAGLDLNGVVVSESVWNQDLKVIVCAIAPADPESPLTEPASAVLRRSQAPAS